MIKCNNDCVYDKFDGCCICCPERDACDSVCELSADYEKCPDAVNEETALMDFKTQELATIQMVADICKQKKQLEAQEKEMKDKLKEAMEKYGITKFESDILKISYVKAGKRSTIDSARLKKELPDIADKYSKESVTSAYIKIEVISR